jgi:hypothetical protein
VVVALLMAPPLWRPTKPLAVTFTSLVPANSAAVTAPVLRTWVRLPASTSPTRPPTLAVLLLATVALTAPVATLSLMPAVVLLPAIRPTRPPTRTAVPSVVLAVTVALLRTLLSVVLPLV